ncbi:serine protease [Entomortierella lignicola]|nr:serine protease [Entomortierella lignicola]
MKSRLILIASIATASFALIVDGQVSEKTQVNFAAPESADRNTIKTESPVQPPPSSIKDEKAKQAGEGVESSSAYVYDISRKSSRGYDVDGRQEVVNVGPGMKITADGQTQSRTGPRGRQRGAVLPNKYIVRLKNGVDFSSVDLHSRVAEHNRLIQVLAQEDHDGQKRVQQGIIPNQVDHEYDFGTWKGYAGQFSSELLKELESRDEVEYVEEDTMMWAWGVGDQELPDQEMVTQDDGSLDAIIPSTLLGKTVAILNETMDFAASALRVEYYSMKSPSWGLTRISEHQRDLQKEYTYVSTAGANVDIYIIDSGVYEDHEDFNGRAFNVANFVPGEADTDTCGHGTHVAGIAAGHHFGVAKAARINAIKVLDSQGQGSTSQVIAGINYMVRHAASRPNTKKVINMSLGGQFSRPVNEAVRAAVTKYNLPFFVAAGNSGDDACQYSPAGVNEAFAVGGSDRSDRVGWYSCVGSCVRVFAPGTGIVSDWIRSSTSTHIADGTSMASPHVAGVAALFLSSDRTYNTAHDLYDEIVRHSTQGVITGLADSKTTRNLLYNKLKEMNPNEVISQDGTQKKGHHGHN